MANMESQFEDQMVHFLDGRICLLGIGNRYWRRRWRRLAFSLKPWYPARNSMP